MKKYLYISAMLLATALLSVSCKNEEPDIFGQSAAERTEMAAKDYTEALTANGGKWVMEYFTNDKEPGYVYVVTFKSDGTVVMSANHKWVGKKFVSDKSLWRVISDNGPVLSFSSYNPVFHVLSEPEDVIDPDKGELDQDAEVDEQGYGHEGDYEFVLMEKGEGFIRLKGKKYGKTIMLRQIDANTDDASYFDQLKASTEKMFSSSFKRLVMTDGTGERFEMTGVADGIVSIFPRTGDAITQTTTANAIILNDGIKFSHEVGVVRAAGGTDSLFFQTFKYQDNGTLVCQEDESIVITAQPLSELMGDLNYTWQIDESSLNGAFATEYQKVADDFKAVYKNKRNLKSISFSADMLGSDMTSCFKVMAGTATGSVFKSTSTTDDTTFSMSLTGELNANANRYMKDVASLKTYLEMLCAQPLTLSAESLLVPSRIKVVSSANQDDYFYVTVQ